MCDKETFVIDLKELKNSDETFSFKLDDECFLSIEGSEIRGGEIESTVKVSRQNGCFKVAFHSKGFVTVDCSRCLDPMRLPIDTQDKLILKLGEEYLDEGDEIITVSETDQLFDTFWHIYEFIALSIPAQHCHEDGECNEEMLEILENSGCSEYSENSEDSENSECSENSQTDPRWAKLQGLLKDNK